jgi:hypothetical protein
LSKLKDTVISSTNLTDVLLKDDTLTANLTASIDTQESKTNFTKVLLRNSTTVEKSTNLTLIDFGISETNSTIVFLQDDLLAENSTNRPLIDTSISETNLTNVLLRNSTAVEKSTNLPIIDTLLSERNPLIDTSISERNPTNVLLRNSTTVENSTNRPLIDTLISKTNLTNVLLRYSTTVENSTNRPLIDTSISERNPLIDTSISERNPTNLFLKDDLLIDSKTSEKNFTNVQLNETFFEELEKSEIKTLSHNQSYEHAVLSNLNSSQAPTINNRSSAADLSTNNLQSNVSKNFTEAFSNVSKLYFNQKGNLTKNNLLNNKREQLNKDKNCVTNSTKNNDLIALNVSRIKQSQNNSLNRVANVSKKVNLSIISNNSEISSKTQDESNWKEIEKIKKFSFQKEAQKSKLKEHYNRTLEKTSKIELYFQSIFSKVFSKMPIDCGTKSCSLEFHQRSDVRNLLLTSLATRLCLGLLLSALYLSQSLPLLSICPKYNLTLNLPASSLAR